MSDQEPKPEQTPETMTVTHSTGEKQIPTDKVLELASRGLDLEVREQGLAQREAALNSQEKALPEYGRLKDRLQADPSGLKALDETISDPGFVVRAVAEARSRAAGGEEGGDLEDLTQRRAVATPEVDVLRREITELRTSIASIGNKDRAKDARSAATEMLTQYPWLSDSPGSLNAAGDMAMNDMITNLNQNTHLSAEAAAASAATSMRKVLELRDGKALTRQDERDQLDLADLSKALPNPAQDKPFTAKDFGTGRLTDAALKVAQFMGIKQA